MLNNKKPVLNFTKQQRSMRLF